MTDVQMGDEFSHDELTRVRARIHNLADKVQGHEIALENHRVEILRLNEAIRDLRQTTVTQGQFVTLVADILELRTNSATKTELTAATSLQSVKMEALIASIGSLEKAQTAANAERKAAQEKTDAVIAKVAWFIILAVLSAVLALVITNKGSIARAATALKPMVEVLAFGPVVGGEK
jgi:hypothetical protein